MAVELPPFEIPEDLVSIFTLNIGGKSVTQIEVETETVRHIDEGGRRIIRNREFKVHPKVTAVLFGKLQIHNLGLRGTPSIDQILEKIPQCRVGEYVLGHCRPETGLHLAIADQDQPLGAYYYVMHKPITDHQGISRIFELDNYPEKGLCVYGSWATHNSMFNPNGRIVVTLNSL